MKVDWKDPDYESVVLERMARLQGLRAAPDYQQLIAGLREFYREHPVEFISDWGFTFDPRRAENMDPVKRGTVIPFVLFPKQVEYITWLYERWRSRENGLVEKSRDMGITWLCVGFAVWMWTFHAGSVVGFGSRKEEYVDKIGDPKSIFWKIRFFIELLPDELKPEGYRTKTHAPHMRVMNPAAGSAIVGEAGDNIGRGNRTSIYFLDEAAFVEHPEAVEAALSQTSNCRIDASTPNGPGNLFYRKRHGGKVKVFVFDWRDDPRKGMAWYEKQRNDLDPVTLAQEVDRDYEGSVGDHWIDGKLVTDAQIRGPADVRPVGGLRVGIDPARFGDDKSVISFRRGRLLIKLERRGKIDVVQCASWARNEILTMLAGTGAQLEQIAVDTIGIGAGVADIMRTSTYFPDIDMGRSRVRRIVVDVNSAIRLDDGMNYNLRAYMAREVKEWLKAGGVLPNDPDLKAAMTSFKYSFKGGLLLCEDKDAVKARLGRSPDDYDSIALTFGVPTHVEEELPRTQPWRPAVAGVGM